jgi:ubiquinone/menaquinone biosynthesis C-methylase UbiE
MSESWDVEAFFATGVTEIRSLMEDIARLGVTVGSGRALDFGCGVGRLSQGLAAYFDEVCGVDIAPSMIEQARSYNAHGERCRYYLNQSGDLGQFADASFDLIYSNITLQHIEPRYSKEYLREFLRVLAPQGLLVFQLPSELICRNRLKRAVRAVVPEASLQLYRRMKFLPADLLRSLRSGRAAAPPRMEMYGIERGELVRYLESCGARVVACHPDHSATAHSMWTNYRYFVTHR